MKSYIWQNKNWPNFTWDENKIAPLEQKVINKDGFLQGVLSTFSDDYIQKHGAKIIAKEIERSWKIEGEHLDELSVYSSVCRKLNIEDQIKAKKTSHIEKIVDVTIDAIRNINKTLDKNRIFNWHEKMFPLGLSQGKSINIGEYRKLPIDVISGEMGKEEIIYTALEADKVEDEMELFFKWVNSSKRYSPFLTSAIAHLWFVTIHPFEDGNGRIARAISDFILYKNRKIENSFYAVSSQIKLEQRDYYKELNKAQTSSNLDITFWLFWYLNCVNNAIDKVTDEVKETLKKEQFFIKLNSIKLNKRQRKMIEKIMDNWAGNINTTKWAKICKCSQDTATRDLNDLIDKGLFKKNSKGPRTNYELIY